MTGVTNESWARTGYLGFLRRTECSQSGSILDETTPSIASRDSDTESVHSQVRFTIFMFVFFFKFPIIFFREL